MIAICHPLVRMVDREDYVLRSLITDMPKLYEEWLDDVEKQIEADAREDAGDDDEVYLSICSSYSASLSEMAEIPGQSRGYLLAAIYAFFERNVRNVYKELGIVDYWKASVSVDSVFSQCNVIVIDNQELHDELEVLGLVRHNLSHGRLSNEDNWNRLAEYVKNSSCLEMQDDVVQISDNAFLLHALDIVNKFFAVVFKVNEKFKTRYI